MLLNDGARTWEKLGRIVAPDPSIYWMSTFAGPSFAKVLDESGTTELYVTGRDSRNRSAIGCARINLNEPQKILSITPDPIFTFGELGAFDENGVSYPFFVEADGQEFMFYVGWMPTVLTPFQNHLGLAKRDRSGAFTRVSRAPILERTNDDYLSIGSCCALNEKGRWRLWYTCFERWGKKPGEHKHYYVIKYAESQDGLHWKRENQVCIGIEKDEEYSIGRPSVIHYQGFYHMWYSVRGSQYRIGYARSTDGIHWQRMDRFAGIAPSVSGWDSEAQCYAHVFRWRDDLYMIYNGNQYGKEGLGLARLVRSS